MASPTRWAWVWVNSRSLWCTGRPGMLWFMGSQRVGHDWATELNWTELNQLSMHTRPRRYKVLFFPKYLSSEFQTCKIKPILATMYQYWLLSDHNNCCYSVAKLQRHGLWHTKFPCPSLSPRVCSRSCPLSQWCYLTISSSVIPFTSSSQSFPASGSFPMSWLFTSGGQSIGASASASDLPIPGWFPLGLTGFISIPAITK